MRTKPTITVRSTELDMAIEEASAAHDTMLQLYGLLVQGLTRAALGDSDGAHASANASMTAAADLMEFFEDIGRAIGAAAHQAAASTRRPRGRMSPRAGA